jgi:hypothetical protein
MNRREVLQDIFDSLRVMQGIGKIDYDISMVTDVGTGYLQVNAYDENDNVHIYTMTVELKKEN